MTTQSDFKARVRERMAKTGERYAAARAVLLAQAADPPRERAADARAAAVPGYGRFGGEHTESAAIANLLRHAGVVAPHTGEPFSEALVFGLAGGIGFMSFAFDYADHLPILTVVLRADSYPDAFVRRALARVGAPVSWHETGSPKAAATALDAALAAGRAALVVVDVSRLPWYGLGEELVGFGPTYVAVAGRAGDRLAIDDRAPRPLLIDESTLASARAGYRKGRHALATVEGSVREGDLPSAVLDAVRATARGFHEAPYKGYASNFGVRGLEKWARQIDDVQDPRGWPRLLARDSALASALVRMFEGIHLEFTPPSGGRRLYAAFLDEATTITGRDELRAAGHRYRDAAEAWDRFADAALPADDAGRGALRRVLEARRDRIDALGADAAGPNRELRAERERLVASATFDPAERASLLAALGGLAREVVAAERAALDALEDAAA